MAATEKRGNLLIFKGSSFFRQRLALSVLSGKSVKIEEIRKYADEPGLQEYEVNLIRLLDKITNGTIIELDETGTNLFFQPGLIHGGSVDHNCSLERSVGYYLEVLILLAPFCKFPIHATLRGVTNNKMDPSPDHIKASILPLLRKFIINDEGLELKVLKRGMRPLGGGEVLFKCPVQKQLKPVQLLNSGLVKRIRGIAYALRTSPTIANRMIESAKGVLLNFISDVFISTDQCRGKQSGKSPGFGIHLIAETTTGVFYSVEAVSNIVSEGEEPSIPEDIGVNAAERLLQEIYYGGCTDSACQSVVCLFMALGQKNVSQIVVGPLTEYSISFLRHLREFFGITFKIEHHFPKDEETEIGRGGSKVNLTCIGVGYSNLNRRVI